MCELDEINIPQKLRTSKNSPQIHTIVRQCSSGFSDDGGSRRRCMGVVVVQYKYGLNGQGKIGHPTKVTVYRGDNSCGNKLF